MAPARGSPLFIPLFTLKRGEGSYEIPVQNPADMRFSKERVAGLAKTVVETLTHEGLIGIPNKRSGTDGFSPAVGVPTAVGGPTQMVSRLVSRIEGLILGELQSEDRLNEEVREIMKRYEQKIREGQADYQTLFRMIKKQLIRERE